MSVSNYAVDRLRDVLISLKDSDTDWQQRVGEVLNELGFDKSNIKARSDRRTPTGEHPSDYAARLVASLKIH